MFTVATNDCKFNQKNAQLDAIDWFNLNSTHWIRNDIKTAKNHT